MMVLLYPQVVPAADRLRVWVGITACPQPPALTWLLDGRPLDPGRVVAARAEARDVPGSALGEDRLWLTFHAPPPGGLEATFTVEDGGPLRLRVVDGSDGLSGLPGFEPRPPGVDAARSHSSDLVVVGATTDLG